jgi:hypothetical protein
VLTLKQGQSWTALVGVPLSFDDAVHRANIFAARSIVVSDAFDTSCGVNDVDVTFGDGFGRAFWQAGATGNAIVLNFHSHSNTLLNEILITLLILILGQGVK